MNEVNVVLDGTVLPGFAPDEARRRLADLIGRDEGMAAKLLSGRPVTIKSGIDANRGEQYLKALSGAGVSARLESTYLQFDDAVWASEVADVRNAVAPSETPAPTASAPQRSEAKGMNALRKSRGWRIATIVVGVLVFGGAILRTAINYWSPKTKAPIASLPTPDRTVPKAMPQRAESNREILPAEQIPLAPKAAPPAAASAPRSDLAEIFKSFMVPVEASYTLPAWDTGIDADSPIHWQPMGANGMTKPGNVKVTFRGSPLYVTPEGKPGEWEITLSGLREGVYHVGLNIAIPDGNTPPFEKALNEGGVILTPYKCHDVQQPASAAEYVWSATAAGKKPAWVAREWSCGSGGCIQSVALVLTKDAADGQECVVQ